MNRILSAPLLLLIHGYRLVLSPLVGHTCRYAPSCSAYALEAIRTHGPFRGTGLAVGRILKCHPWGGEGYDPVPPSSSPGPSKGSSHGSGS